MKKIFVGFSTANGLVCRRSACIEKTEELHQPLRMAFGSCYECGSTLRGR